MKNIFMLCAIMLFVSIKINAQESVIKGKITDENGKFLEHVIIKLENSEIFTETNQKGEFQINANQNENALISHMNYKSKTIGLTNGIIIVLEEMTIQLNNIILKADPFGDIAQSEIIYDDIKATTQPRNVSDLFKDIPGFGIQKRGAYASEPVFRAFKYEQLNVQYDGGMKILNACPNRMDPITTHVIPEEIEKIEIIRGPFTVRFGQNFGGIINMVSKSGHNQKEGFSGNIEAGYETNGNNLTTRGTLVYKQDKFDLELNGSYRDYGDYTDGNGTEVPSSFKTTDYSVKLGYNPDDNQRFRFTWRQSFGRDIKHAGLMMDSPYDDSYLAGLDYKITDISNLIDAIVFKGFYSHVDHLMTNEDRPSFKMTGASSNVFVTTFGGKTEFILKPSDRLNIFTGLDANFIARDGDRIRTVKIMNGNPLPEPKIMVDKIWQDSEVNDIGVFVEGKYKLFENTILTAGLRSDFISTSINDPEQDFFDLYEINGEIKDQSEVNLSGNLSLAYKVNKTELQFAFGRGMRTASMIERYINHFNIGSDPYEYVGNPYLDPETNNQFEISVKQRFDQLEFGATVFYSFLEDYITAVVDESLPRKFMPTVEPVFAKRFINIDKAMQTGFEVYFNYHITSSLSFLSDLAYTYGENKDFDEPLPQITPLTAHLGLNYDKEKYWFNLKSRLVDNQDRISKTFKETETPGFATFDFSAGVKPMKGLTVGAAVLNIFDKAYYEHLNFSYKNSDIMSGRIYEPGRNFTLYLNYSF
ncbi:MAG: TonB-dependent receptor [Flavobacteriaceae bacterium]|nr:TonB-dependent receptor [Flavobacteriaceae bacterium]